MINKSLFLSVVAASNIYAATINFTNTDTLDNMVSKLGISSGSSSVLGMNIIKDNNIKAYDFFLDDLIIVSKVTKDDLNIYGTKDKILNIKSTLLSPLAFIGNNVSINYANISGLNLDLGDDVYLKSSNNKYYRTFLAKQYNNKAIATINNSKINSSNLLVNKLNVNNSTFNDFNIVANELNLHNSTLDASNGGFLKVFIKSTGANNNLIIKNGTYFDFQLKGDVDKSFFNIKSSDVGISSIEPALVYAKSKDGYTIFNNLINEADLEDFYTNPEKQKSYENLYSGLMQSVMYQLEISPIDGKVSQDAKEYKVFKELGIIDENDYFIESKFFEKLQNLEEIVAENNGNLPIYPEIKPENPNTKPNPKPESKPWTDLTPAKPISTSINIPKVADVINGISMKLESLANMTFKDNSKVDGFVKDSNEEALYNAMYEAPKVYKNYEDGKIASSSIASPKLSDITINATNITNNSQYFPEFASANSINVLNSTLTGLNLRSGEQLSISDANGDYIFKDALKTGKGTINLINSRLLNTEIRADTVNIHDVDLIGGVDDSVIFANQLNATKLNIIDGGAIVYGRATGGQNTLGASAKAITNANDKDPISIAFIKEGANDFFKIASTNTGISSITPAGIKGITKDGFKVFAIGSDAWVKSISDTDGSLKLNALAIALGEGSFKADDFYATDGKLKTDTEFYKLLASKGAIDSDGNINLGALGGVHNTKKITSETINQSFLDSIANSKDKNTGISYADVTLNKPLEASKDLAATIIEAKNLNITSDVKGFDLDSSKASEKTNLFMDKTFGKLNIEGQTNKLVNIENNTIKSNELNIKNAVVKTENLASNKLNLDNVTIDTTKATKDTIITALDGATINNLKVNASNKFATIIIIKNLTGKFSKEDISIQAAQVARAAATTADQVSVKVLEDGTISYIVDPSKNSEVAKALENGASAEQAILVDKGILTSDLKIAESADKTLVETLKTNGVLSTKEDGSVVVDNTSTFENLIKENAPTYSLSQTKQNQVAINLAHTALNQARFAYNLEINNMTKRLGEIRNLEGEQGVWLRSYAGKGSYKDYQDIKYYSFTMGADKYISDDTLLGVSLGYNRQDLSKEISGKQDTIVLSAYATKMYNNGLYLDGVIKYLNSKGKYENELLGNSSDKKLSSKTQHAVLASIEAGYRMPVGEKLIIEPQAELITGYIPSNEIKSDKLVMKSNSYMPVNIKTGVNAIVKPNDKLELRAGAGGIFDLNDGKVKYEIKDIFGTKDTRTGKNSRAYANLFGSYKLNNNTRINLEAERTFGGDFKVNYNFNLNLRYQF